MSKQIITIYPCRDFSIWTKPPQIIKANVPRQALQMDPFRVGFKVAGEVVILTNTPGKPEWRMQPQ